MPLKAFDRVLAYIPSFLVLTAFQSPPFLLAKHFHFTLSISSLFRFAVDILLSVCSRRLTRRDDAAAFVVFQNLDADYALVFISG